MFFWNRYIPRLRLNLCRTLEKMHAFPEPKQQYTTPADASSRTVDSVASENTSSASEFQKNTSKSSPEPTPTSDERPLEQPPPPSLHETDGKIFNAPSNILLYWFRIFAQLNQTFLLLLHWKWHIAECQVTWKLRLSVDLQSWLSFVGLYDILKLFPRSRTLNVLDFTVSLYDGSPDFPLPLPLSGLCEELEAAM